MYYQYPLETLARRHSVRSQIEFAREARRALYDTDEVLFEPADHGLAIFAAHEEALFEPTRVLRELYGKGVEVRSPRVRYLPGEPAQEPIMHVRALVRREFADTLLRELRCRDARVLEECHLSRIFIARAEAPLARLLGLSTALEAISDATSVCNIALTRYAPVDAWSRGVIRASGSAREPPA
jgi:hypothetical protein